MTTKMIPVHVCLCGYEMDATSGAGHDHLPKKDDVSLCMRCGRFWLFNEDLTQREPTEEEVAEMRLSPCWQDLEHARKLILTKPFAV